MHKGGENKKGEKNEKKRRREREEPKMKRENLNEIYLLILLFSTIYFYFNSLI